MNKAEKIILPVLKHFVLLQRSKSSYGVKTVGKSVGFFYTHLRNVKPSACWCAVAVMPARIGNLILNDTCKPFLLNVLKASYNEHTASNDGGKDRNRKSPCLHSLGAQIHRHKHHSEHRLRTHLLFRREYAHKDLCCCGGWLRDIPITDVFQRGNHGEKCRRRIDRRLAL